VISKKVSIFKRTVKSKPDSRLSDEHHTEKVVLERWWLFGFIPLYSRENVVTNNL
jgi:hypothetical protein